jgi:hypothetical protein
VNPAPPNLLPLLAPCSLHSFLHHPPFSTRSAAMLVAKSLTLFSLVLSTSALATPHDIYRAHHRHAALTQRNAPPSDSQQVPSVDRPALVRNRSLGKRCRAQPHSANTTASAVSSSDTPVGNIGGASKHPTSTPTSKKETPTKTSSAPASTAGLPSYMIGTQSGQGMFATCLRV